MPGRTRVPCKWPLCPALVQPGEGYCAKHKSSNTKLTYQQRRADPVRAQFDRFYSTGAWGRARLMYLRSHPLCIRCGQAGTLVDHIVPRRAGGGSLDEANFQTLCDGCHRLKTAEDAKRYNL